MEKSKLLLHPVRTRIIRILSNRELNTEEIMGFLDDVPQATLYRHIKVLLDNNVIVITKEEKIRGTISRTYTLRKSSATITKDELDKTSNERLRSDVASFTAVILSDFHRFTEHAGKENRSRFYIEQDSVFLSEEEYMEMVRDIRGILEKYEKKSPEGRKMHHVSNFIIPD